MAIIDLDNTLVKTDLLIEASVLFFKKNPLRFWQLILWALHGPIYFKQKLANAVAVDPAELPYDQQVLDLIRKLKGEGQRLILVSASPQKWVSDVAFHLDIFDEYLGSQDTNLKGLKKYEAVKNRFGVSEFLYVADSICDVPVWQNCKQAVVVNGSHRLFRRLDKSQIPYQKLNTKMGRWKAFYRLIRIHQWAKNALLFAPFLAAHQWDFIYRVDLLWGFISFSLAASSVYVFNDLLDIQSDRLHRTKKNRPIANGDISILKACAIFVAVLTFSFFFGAMVNEGFVQVVLGYLGLNVLYTLYLKRQMALDILILSGMYTIRLYAGAAITLTPISDWLLAYSTFFFFGLACVKRYTELLNIKGPSVSGRGYGPHDSEMIRMLGACAGMLSILVLLLYIQSPEISALYGESRGLWLLAPIMLFWTARLWILASRKLVDDDPVLFAIRDGWSWVCLGGVLLLLGVSST